MKKIAIVACTLCILLSGCAKDKEYIRSTQAGAIQQTTMEDVYDKFEKKESFVLLVTLSYCSHCHDLKTILEPYLKNHEVIVYELIMDKLMPTNDEYEKAKEKLNQYLKDYQGTPSFYSIKDGKKEAEIIGFGGDGADKIDLDTYDAFIQKYQLDAQ